MLLIRSIEAEIQVSHEEVQICDGVRLDHLPLTEQPNILQNALRHRKALIDGILARFKMAVHKAKHCIVESELDHHSTLPAVTEHVLHDVVLANVAQKPAIVFFDEDYEEDLALAHKVYLYVLLAQIAMY